MNVFILSTGRCGSTTIARAFSHATNYTSGHETRAGLVEDRLDYPEDHIESDNRLSWFLGGLDERFGDEAFYVHLTRDPERVVASYLARWEWEMTRQPRSWAAPRWRAALSVLRHGPETVFRQQRNPSNIVPAFAHGIVIERRPTSATARRRACELYVETVTTNIGAFLKDKTRVMSIDLGSLADDFTAAWTAICADGPLERAVEELSVRHNALATASR